MGGSDPHPDRRPAAITGASSGIGAETARLLARSGHPVVLGARRLGVCEEIAASSGPKAVRRRQSVSTWPIPSPSWNSPPGRTPRSARSRSCVSNAARIQLGSALDTEPEDFEEILRVNVGGAQRLVRAFGPGMVERGRGDLLFVTSDVVVHPRPRMSAYVASKWGLEGFVTALQMELEGTGVRAIMVRPGPTITGMGAEFDPDETVAVLEEWTRWGLVRHGGFLQPEGVALAIAHAVAAPRGMHLSVLEVQPEAPTLP